MNIKIDIRQLKELEKQLLKAGPKTTKAAQLELKATAFETNEIAKSLAPIDRGGLKGSMAFEPITKSAYKIGNNRDYAPYVEFGTGSVADIPAEWSSFALQFKGATGKGWDNGLEEITRWCIKKGIPEEAAYPIFMSILESGVIATPFLYPAFKEGRKLLVKRVTQVIKDFKLE